jgi:hypothetical protein
MMVLLVFFLTLLLSVFALWHRGHRLISTGQIVRAYSELFIPFSLVVLYGFGGAVALTLSPDDRAFRYGIKFTDVEIVASFLIMLSGGIAFWFAVASGRYSRKVERTVIERARLHKDAVLLMYPLLAIDIYVRFQKISSGVYFTWMSGRAKELYDVQESSLWLLGDKLSPIIFSLLVVAGLKRRWFLILGASYIFLVLLAGSRTPLIFTLIAGGASYLYCQHREIKIKKLLKVAGWFLFFSALFFESINASRQAFRLDVKGALDDPSKFIVNIATVHIPNRLNPFHEDENVDAPELASTWERLSLNSQSLASQLNKLLSGQSHLPLQQFFAELSLAVPSVLMKNKQANTFGQQTNQHLGVSGDDPATTIFSSMFLHWSLPGLFVFSFIVGLIWAWFGTYLQVYFRGVGVVLWFGGIIAFEIGANSFGSFFSGVRDFILIMIFCGFILKIGKVRLPVIGTIHRAL